MYKSYREKIDCLEKAVVIFTKDKAYNTLFLQQFDVPIFLEDDSEIRQGVGLVHDNPACIVYGCPNITVLRGNFEKIVVELLKKYVSLKIRKSGRLAKKTDCKLE